MRTFGKVLKEFRKAAGLSTAKLAEKSGIAEYNIISFEDDIRSPEFDMLFRLADALKINVSQFL